MWQLMAECSIWPSKIPTHNYQVATTQMAMHSEELFKIVWHRKTCSDALGMIEINKCTFHGALEFMRLHLHASKLQTRYFCPLKAAWKRQG